MMNDLKSYFLLDPDIVFLNHGSFGATPHPVFEVYQEWQRRLERQPVRFLGRENSKLDCQARQALAAYLHTDAMNLAFVTNATQGVNIVARSLPLRPGDEILSTDHEYGACEFAWEFVCGKTGARYVRRPIHLPLTTPENIVEQIWEGVNPRTRVIFLSHITSPTAVRLPVEAICARARAAGILTVIDGAHAPGQIPLNLDETGADFYTGNCHKWMLAPKGAAFLYARPEVQPMVEPLVVSWGYHSTPETTNGSQYLDYLQWTGTKDPAAALSVPAAIEFMQAHEWEQVQRSCQALLSTALERISDLTGLPLIYPALPHGQQPFYAQMGAAFLPPIANVTAFKNRLYDEFRVEVPVTEWNGRALVRISIQGYNTAEDVEALIKALKHCLN